MSRFVGVCRVTRHAIPVIHSDRTNERMQNENQQNQVTDNAGKLPRLAYTMRETAEIIGVSYITVHRLIKRGKLRASDALRNKVIPRTEIERFLRESVSAS